MGDKITRHWKKPAPVPEYNSGIIHVEQYADVRIADMLFNAVDAGRRLRASRVARFDFESEMVDNGYTPPTRSPEWELLDHYEDYKEALYRVEAAKEEYQQHKEKDVPTGNPLPPKKPETPLDPNLDKDESRNSPT